MIRERQDAISRCCCCQRVSQLRAFVGLLLAIPSSACRCCCHSAHTEGRTGEWASMSRDTAIGGPLPARRGMQSKISSVDQQDLYNVDPAFTAQSALQDARKPQRCTYPALLQAHAENDLNSFLLRMLSATGRGSTVRFMRCRRPGPKIRLLRIFMTINLRAALTAFSFLL